MDVSTVDDFVVESTTPADELPPQTPTIEVDAAPSADASTAPEQADAVADPSESERDSPTEQARDDKGRFAKSEKPRDNPQARIAQLTARQRDAERKAAELEAELAVYRAGRIAPSAAGETTPATAPKLEDFTDYDDYLRAAIRHEAAEIARQTVAQQRQAEIQAQRADLYRSNLDAARERYPDLDEVINRPLPVEPPQVLQEAILSSPRNADLAYYLGTHPEEYVQLAREVATASPDAAPWVRRYLESKLSAAASPGSPAPKPVSAAKPPIKPVGSSPTPAADPLVISDDLPFEEHVRRMNALDRKRKRGEL